MTAHEEATVTEIKPDEELDEAAAPTDIRTKNRHGTILPESLTTKNRHGTSIPANLTTEEPEESSTDNRHGTSEPAK